MSGTQAIAGGLAGLVSFVATYPIQLASTRKQIEAKEKGGKSQYSGSPLSTILKILQEEGISSLYSGLQSGMFGIVVTQTVYYYFYAVARNYFEALEGTNQLSARASSLCAIFGGTLTSVSTNPIWVVNTRLQQKNSKGFTATAMQLYQEDGISGFFKGVLPALILVINPTIQYTVFDTLKIYLEGKGANRRQLSGFEIFLLGAIGKVAATVVTYPYILAKSRLQVARGSDTEKKPNGVLEVFGQILKRDGPAGLYAGLNDKALGSVLTSALLFMFQDKFVRFVNYIWVLTGVSKK